MRLPDISVFFKHSDLIRSVLWQTGMSAQRVEISMLMLQMYLYYRRPLTASLRYYSGETLTSYGTAKRLVVWLREEGWATTKRLRNPQQPEWLWVNELDLGAMVRVLADALRVAFAAKNSVRMRILRYWWGLFIETRGLTSTGEMIWDDSEIEVNRMLPKRRGAFDCRPPPLPRL